MGGELSKREVVLLHSFQSEAGSFCCSFHRFTKIYALITISLLDIGFKWCFVISFFCFERVHLAMRGCTCALRGSLRTLKTPNSPPWSELCQALASFPLIGTYDILCKYPGRITNLKTLPSCAPCSASAEPRAGTPPREACLLSGTGHVIGVTGRAHFCRVQAEARRGKERRERGGREREGEEAERGSYVFPQCWDRFRPTNNTR